MSEHDSVRLLGAEPPTPHALPPPAADEHAARIPLEADAPHIAEPRVGPLMREFDAEAARRFRLSLPYVKYSPAIFARRAQPPPVLSSAGSLPVNSYSQLLSAIAAPDGVLTVDLSGQTFTPRDARELMTTLLRFQNVLELRLVGCGLKSVEQIRLPHVRTIDLRDNLLADVKSVARMVAACPELERLALRGNGCANKPRVRERLAACSQSLALRVIDDRELSVRERLAGISAFGGKHMRQELEPLRFDLVFSALPAVRQMATWQPEQLVDVDLRRCELVLFHVGTLRNLQRLRLGFNRISNLRGMGLERCSRLRRVEFEHNALAKRENLRVFSLMPGLAHVSLYGNPQLGDYRIYVVAQTMFLRGSNRAPGIQTIDHRVVSIDERTSGAEFLQRASSKHAVVGGKMTLSPEHQRWRFHLIQCYGHEQLRMREFAEEIRVCAFRSASLQVVNLGMFRKLAVLDLKDNQLIEVPGLDALPGLKLLNLADNPKLRLQSVLRQLQVTAALEQVMFAVATAPQIASASAAAAVATSAAPIATAGSSKRVAKSTLRVPPSAGRGAAVPSDEVATAAPPVLLAHAPAATAHKRAKGTPKYQLQVVKALFHHENLRFLDGESIPGALRVDAYRAHGASDAEAEHYRWRLALNASCTLGFSRQHHPKHCAIGAQYDPSAITALRRTAEFGLRSGVVELSMFRALQQLSLANNKLTTTQGLGLEQLPELSLLELHNNLIQQPLSELSALLDKCSKLEIVTLRENPVMRGDARSILLGGITRLRSVECTLKILDTPITIAERCSAWAQYGGATAAEVEALRWPALRALRCPDPALDGTLTHLALSNAGLEQVDVRAFAALAHLDLAGNRIANLARVVGLLDLPQLAVLNLQRNQLADAGEVARLCDSLPLIALGLAQNPLAHAKHWRLRFLQALPSLVKNCTLRSIDNVRITPGEICEAHAKMAGRGEADVFRFRVALHRQLPTGETPSTVVELDLSKSGLKFKNIDLSQLRSIKKLVLAHNNMQSKHLAKSNLVRCAHLEHLDMSHNSLNSLKIIGSLLEHLRNIRTCSFECNPCHPAPGQDAHRVALLLPHAPRLLSAGRAHVQLNGVAIPAHVRCAVVQRLSGKAAAEQLAAELALAPFAAAQTTALNLSHRALAVLGPLARFQLLTVLIVSHNELHTLPPTLLEPLAALRKLDIRHNQLALSLDAIVDVARRGSALTSLYIFESTADRRVTGTIEEYAPIVTKAIPQLNHCDGFVNQYKPGRTRATTAVVDDGVDTSKRPPAFAPHTLRRQEDEDERLLDDGDDDDEGEAANTGDSDGSKLRERGVSDAWGVKYARRYSANPLADIGESQRQPATLQKHISGVDLYSVRASKTGVSGVDSHALAGAVYGDSEFVPNLPTASAPPAFDDDSADSAADVSDDDERQSRAALHAADADDADDDSSSSDVPPPPPPGSGTVDSASYFGEDERPGSRAAGEDASTESVEGSVDDDDEDAKESTRRDTEEYLPKDFRKSVYGVEPSKLRGSFRLSMRDVDEIAEMDDLGVGDEDNDDGGNNEAANDPPPAFVEPERLGLPGLGGSAESAVRESSYGILQPDADSSTVVGATSATAAPPKPARSDLPAVALTEPQAPQHYDVVPALGLSQEISASSSSAGSTLVGGLELPPAPVGANGTMVGGLTLPPAPPKAAANDVSPDDAKESGALPTAPASGDSGAARDGDTIDDALPPLPQPPDEAMPRVSRVVELSSDDGSDGDFDQTTFTFQKSPSQMLSVIGDDDLSELSSTASSIDGEEFEDLDVPTMLPESPLDNDDQERRPSDIPDTPLPPTPSTIAEASTQATEPDDNDGDNNDDDSSSSLEMIDLAASSEESL